MKMLRLFLGTLWLGSTFLCSAQPTNDHFENAALVSTSPMLGSNVDATRQSGEPETVLRPGFERLPLGGRSVWWRWVAPRSGLYTVSTADRTGALPSSQFDTQIGVYSGTALENLVEVASNEDNINYANGASSVSFRAVSGKTYYILLDGFEGQTGAYALYVGETCFFLNVTSNPSEAGSVQIFRSFQAEGYKAGTMVRVRAVPRPGRTFYGWTGATNSTNMTILLAMNSDKTLVANYVYDHQLILQRTTGQITAWQLLGTNYGNFRYLEPMPAGWKLLTTADLDLNGTPDLLFQHRDNRLTAHLMNGNSKSGSANLGSARAGYRLAGSGDFNMDSEPDLLLQNTNGALQVVFLKGLRKSGQTELSSVEAGWTAATVADLDLNGSADILFQHRDGRIAVWLMEGTTPITTLDPGRSTWKLVSVLDVNNDGVQDLIFQTAGRAGVWLLNNKLERVSSIVLANRRQFPASWRLAATSK